MNYLEACRKGAGWPALHRDVPQFTKGGRWAITQEELAAFVGQVRSRFEDLSEQLASRDQQNAKLSDEKALLAGRMAKMGVKLAAHEAVRGISRTAESMGLEKGQVRQLETAVTDSFTDSG